MDYSAGSDDDAHIQGEGQQGVNSLVYIAFCRCNDCQYLSAASRMAHRHTGVSGQEGACAHSLPHRSRTLGQDDKKCGCEAFCPRSDAVDCDRR